MSGIDSNALTVRERAEELLRRLFAEGGSYRKIDVLQLADEQGISPRTLHSVAKEMGVVMIAQGPNPGIWRAPVDES